MFELFKDSSSLHRIRLDVPEEPVLVACDPVRIEQAMNNLVSNAIKYSPRGGEVRIFVRRGGELGEVAVEDQGMGIREADEALIWEPFKRSGISAESIPGVGLGLSISRQIIEAHGGTLSVQSEVGKGSIFAVHLPLLVRTRLDVVTREQPTELPAPAH